MDNDILGFDAPETSSDRTTEVRTLGFKFTIMQNDPVTVKMELVPTNVITKILFAGFIIGIPVGVLMLAVYGFVRLVGFIFG
jgi:hypothetical protein